MGVCCCCFFIFITGLLPLSAGLPCFTAVTCVVNFGLPLKHHTAEECELRREQTAVFVSELVDRLAWLGSQKKREIRCISHPVRAQAIVFVCDQITDRDISTLNL